MRALAFIAVLLIGPVASATEFFVDTQNPKANDQNDGSQSAPFKTISKAASQARAGDTVFVRPGVYGESVRLEHSGTKEKPIRFIAAEGGTVLVTGADVIRDWRRTDGKEPIYEARWEHLFEIDRKDGISIEHHPGDEPLWGRAEQVICGPRQLLPVKNLADLRAASRKGQADGVDPPLPNLGGPFAGWFFADTINQKMYVALAEGSDPGTSVMQASTRSQLFGVNPWQSKEGVHYVHVKGFTFQFAANFPQRPAVWLHGHDNLLEDCDIIGMSGSGVAVSGTMRNCIINNNGHTGGSAIGENFVNENCSWEGNSWKPINRNWEAGGAKVALSRDGVFRNCKFIRNGGQGLWFDIDVRHVLVEKCEFHSNEKSGLMIEISRDCVVKDCQFSGNGTGATGIREDDDWGAAGLMLAESRKCIVQGNTFSQNRNGLSIRELGPRQTQSIEGPDVEYHSAEHEITGNRFSSNRDYQLAFWYDNPFFGPHPGGADPPERKTFDPSQQSYIIDGNNYTTQIENKFVLFGVPWRKKTREFKSLGELRAATGFEKTGRVTSR